MRRVLGYIALCGFAALFLMVPMSLYFWLEIPRTPEVPDPSHGYVYPYNNHGVTHYVGWFDHLLDNVFQNAAFIVVPLVIVLVVLLMAVRDGARSE
jgi:hypothetical protein